MDGAILCLPFLGPAFLCPVFLDPAFLDDAFHNRGAVVGRAIVHHDDPRGRRGLREDAVQRLLNERSAVV